ncbi:hypothetical protein A9K55_005884 [Cordyceps militaris]|uniref:GPI anchored protein n=1 Tax=Cordyceps militaris TaxID=73501 RepID=A0A2H4SBI0_CORMI|nr:hypothetical protein A9K55_005884 [Cordyceps militaris]
MKLATATMSLLAPTALCKSVLIQAREAKVTPAATLSRDRRAQQDECSEGKTACGDGNGCCPRGAQCAQSQGVGVCADACAGATLFCTFGSSSSVTVCCQPGAACDYAQSVCTQHRTDVGGVWTATTTATSEGTPLPTTPVFSSTADDLSSTDTTTRAEETTQTSSEAAGSSGGAATDGSGTTTAATKTPKDSGSAMVVSWSAGVLAVVFGIMAAL